MTGRIRWVPGIGTLHGRFGGRRLLDTAQPWCWVGDPVTFQPLRKCGLTYYTCYNQNG